MIVDGPVLEPRLLHQAIAGKALGVLDARLGVDQDERPRPLRGGECGTQRQEATLRHPPEHGLLDAEMVQEAEAVLGRVPVCEGLTVEFGFAEPSLVPRDHPELGAERLDLGSEHLAIHQEAMRQDHGRTASSCVLEADALTIDFGEWHGNLGWLGGGATLMPGARSRQGDVALRPAHAA
jgi:hypothetical protein